MNRTDFGGPETPEPPKQSKPPTTITIEKCDGLAVTVEGEKYYPHADESVTFTRARTLGEVMEVAQLSGLADLLSGLQGDSGAGVTDSVGKLAAMIAAKVTAWEWTGDDGEPLGDPSDPETIRGLGMTEQLWLYGRILGRETRDQTGKDSSGSD